MSDQHINDLIEAYHNKGKRRDEAVEADRIFLETPVVFDVPLFLRTSMELTDLARALGNIALHGRPPNEEALLDGQHQANVLSGMIQVFAAPTELFPNEVSSAQPSIGVAWNLLVRDMSGSIAQDFRVSPIWKAIGQDLKAVFEKFAAVLSSMEQSYARTML